MEQILIRRLHTLIEHETEPAFRDVYKESLQRLLHKQAGPDACHCSMHCVQTPFRT